MRQVKHIQMNAQYRSLAFKITLSSRVSIYTRISNKVFPQPPPPPKSAGMTRNVHFAEANVLYSPPLTPSPTHSLLSLPSSADPPTPPPVNTPIFHPRSPYDEKPISLPHTPPLEMQIHFILAYIPGGAPAVRYDLSLHPSILQNQLTSGDFSEPATHPPLPSLIITCSLLSSRWRIEVTSWSHKGAPVTVYDVFMSLYHDLRKPVSPAEYADLLLGDTRGVDEAYYRRCARFESDRDRRTEEGKGIKRVDFLMGRNRFLGLSATEKGDDIWDLKLS